MSQLNPQIKGSIPIGRGNGFDVLPVGPDGQVLTADSTQPLGVKYAAPTGTVDPRDIMRFAMIYNVLAGGA